MTSHPEPPIEEELIPFLGAARGRKAVDLVVLDMRRLTSVADAFVICGGRSSRQVTAIGEHIRRELKQQGLRALHTEGLKEGLWVLIDYGHVVIHVFHEPVRALYDIEGLWADAPRLTVPDPGGQHDG